MADVLDLGNAALAVGQQVEYVLDIQNNAPASLWIVSADASVILPVAADGTPLSWPHEVTLTNGVGTYFLLGVSSGNANYTFRTSGDPTNTTDLASASITVAPPAPGQPTDGEVIIEVTSIAEPILISIIIEQPITTSSA